MVALWSALGVILYLLPVPAFLLLRLQRARSAVSVGLDVIAIVALDLLSVVLLARFVSLEVATLISRAGWLILLGVLGARRRRELWMLRSGLRAWVIPSLLASLGVAISCTLSIPCAIWDRLWHIPLVTSMQGQSTPFYNVFQQHGQLYYHYLGDAHAAMIQVLSFDHIHSSNALSRSHDTMFGLVGFAIGLIAPAFGSKRWLPLMLLTASCLLLGPATLLRDGPGRQGTGHSLINLLTLSFRPHVPLSFLFMLGFTAAALLPVISRKHPARHELMLTLFATCAALALTDEISLALLGLSLGAVWLAAPQSLAARRQSGLWVLFGLALTIIVVFLVCGGTFSLGAPHQATSFVPPQAPGFYQPAIPLSKPDGLYLLFLDMLPVPLIFMAGAVTWLGNRSRAAGVTFLSFALIALVSTALLTTVVVNGDGLESHRFATTMLFLSPFYAFYWLSQGGGSAWGRQMRQLAAALVILGIVPSTLSTIEWLIAVAKPQCTQSRAFWGNSMYYETDCRSQTGSKFGESPSPVYIAHEIWYLVSGCHPLFAPVPDAAANKHALVINWPETGRAGFAKVDRWAAQEPALAFCPVNPSAPDPICNAAVKKKLCQPSGTDVYRCTLSAAQRSEILHPKYNSE